MPGAIHAVPRAASRMVELVIRNLEVATGDGSLQWHLVIRRLDRKQVFCEEVVPNRGKLGRFTVDANFSQRVLVSHIEQVR